MQASLGWGGGAGGLLCLAETIERGGIEKAMEIPTANQLLSYSSITNTTSQHKTPELRQT